MSGGGFDGLAGAGAGRGAGVGSDREGRTAPPDGVRTLRSASPGATRLVLVRHGEAVCNVSGVCGGPQGCEGLTDKGRDQVAALHDRLAESGELAGTDVLYASVLRRAIETAELLAPALVDGQPAGADAAHRVPRVVAVCDLCELHPGDADGLTWTEFVETFGSVDWDEDPDRPIAPGGESWTGFVNRVDGALDALAARHPGQRVAVATHAGVVEASLLAKLPVVGGREGVRLKLRTEHTSLTTWEVEEGQWRLIGYNDASHLATGGSAEPISSRPSRQAAP